MKILIASIDNSHIIHAGGKHIHQRLLQKGLEEAGHSITTVFPPAIPVYKRGFHKLLRICKIESKFGGFKFYMGHMMRSIEKLALEQVRMGGIDLISVQDPGAAHAVINVLKKTGIKIPVILTLHGYFSRELVNYDHFPTADKSNVYDYCMEIEKVALANVTAIVAVDSRIRQYVLDEFKFPARKCTVLFNAIDNVRFHPISREEQKKYKKEHYGADDATTVVLVARRLVKKNGVIFAIKAIKHICNHGLENFKIYLAGSGPEFNEINSEIKKEALQNYVTFLGEVSHDKIDKLYKGADIVLLPSIRSDDIEEATSLSMLEGMACAKVVIASAIGGMKEVITDKENGLLTQEQDPKSIADALLWVFQNKREAERIANRAHVYAQEHHGYKKHSLEYLKAAVGEKN